MEQEGEDVLSSYYDIADSEFLKLDIAQSKLPNSGMGIFAKQAFSVGEVIVEYYGSVMSTANSYDEVFNEQDKMVQIDDKFCVISRGPASRANDIVKWELQQYNSPLYTLYKKSKRFPTHSGVSHNAKISLQPNQKALLRASRSIKAGEEIHIDYGFDYWDFFYRYRSAKSQIV